MTTEVSARVICACCQAEGHDLALETARVFCNVRAHKADSFAVWRCARCASIHARDDVDLARYYLGYPFFSLPSDWRTRVMYQNQLARLHEAGVLPEHTILDYGSGGGNFVRFLRERGYRAEGYDAYASEFSDRAVLERTYDCVFSQDVLEHVPDPAEFLDILHGLTAPGGVIAIGTPEATAIDLQKPEQFAHTLHAPYHRHIFSRQALVAAGTRRSWVLHRYHATQYANTWVPFLNSAFYSYYMRVFDGTIDCLLDPPRLGPLLARLPLTLFWGLLGYPFARKTDVMAIFARGQPPTISA